MELILLILIMVAFSVGNIPQIVSVLKCKTYKEVKVLNLWTYSAVMFGTISMLILLIISKDSLLSIIGQISIFVVFGVLYFSALYKKTKYKKLDWLERHANYPLYPMNSVDDEICDKGE